MRPAPESRLQGAHSYRLRSCPRILLSHSDLLLRVLLQHTATQEPAPYVAPARTVPSDPPLRIVAVAYLEPSFLLRVIRGLSAWTWLRCPRIEVAALLKESHARTLDAICVNNRRQTATDNPVQFVLDPAQVRAAHPCHQNREDRKRQNTVHIS